MFSKEPVEPNPFGDPSACLTFSLCVLYFKRERFCVILIQDNFTSSYVSRNLMYVSVPLMTGKTGEKIEIEAGKVLRFAEGIVRTLEEL